MNTSFRFISGQAMGIAYLLTVSLLCSGCDDDKKSTGPENELPGRYYITVYYTPVETYHGGPEQQVSGFTSISGESGQVLLGQYPKSFIDAVQMQGSGRITSGDYAGKYLNGSFGGGFWLSDFAPDAYGEPLRPFSTAAADDNVLAPGTRFKLKPPLVESGGSPIHSGAADKLLAATWDVQDHFEAGYGGNMHIDLYIGEEDKVGFTTDNPFYVALENVTIATY